MRDNTDPMTAIVSIYTPEGFVIGADGRRTVSGTRYVATDKAKKIFPLNDRKRLRCCYAWSGDTILCKTDGTNFSFVDATRSILLSGVTDGGTIAETIDLFNGAMSALLFLSVGRRLPPDLKTSHQDRICQAQFLCYFDGRRCSFEIEIPLMDGVIQPARVIALLDPALPAFNIFSGSKRVYEEQYKHRIEVGAPSSDEAVKLIRDYIEMCFDFQDTDEECARIGGHIHIGKLSPTKFSWIYPPLSSS